ncbi:glycogen/starch/alpha-glucan phosphorylase [Oceanispirochaeta sp.]|uniref:glycogen/starch/alpha-glucan phosphorylase n=1 Tax=Oceanispirochaeta sp. TaxID=2035350 RepID=UPI00263A025F|nr:glycogen/starch/alpha-glucan phosphorylase [Oceanispirochaeta sp.]MDA3958422.1 glycogen/starch/alpha-glucan phosphorylase [Oceanispirochaeta sp.]
MTGKTTVLKQLERLLDSQGEPLSSRDFLLILSSCIKQEINLRRETTSRQDRKDDPRRVCYLSAEFLTGRLLYQNLLAMGIKDQVSRIASRHMLTLTDILEEECDPALGNGGLGRLASCFLDSLVHLDLPATGYGICYRFGLFKQSIQGQRQRELPDNWRENDLWGQENRDVCYRIPFGGSVDINHKESGELQFKRVPEYEILAIAVDYPVSSTISNRVQPLRLWKSESPEGFDLERFNNGEHNKAWTHINEAESLTSVLYPGDSGEEGKKLRLKQQYFFVSASLQDMMAGFKEKHGSKWSVFPDKIVIQLNDTHPVLAIPELMRLLLDQEELTWEEAWDICTRVFAFTNHTVLEEALEKWPVTYLKQILPRIMLIIEEIQRRLEKESGIPSIIRGGNVHMASLAVYGSFSVNGVAALHSRLLTETVLKDWYACFPERFNNKTNGITHRRWLMQCNPALTNFINELIGAEWQTSPDLLSELSRFKDDTSVLDRLGEIKKENKNKFGGWLQKEKGLSCPSHFLFDFQVKRIHEYKRQLLNIFSILQKYRVLRENPSTQEIPHIFLIGGKAAPGYYMAKEIIHLACRCSTVINEDPICRDKLQLRFLPRYNVSMAEKIFPASDLSQQISTAGKEASGTGNMKFMMNGALTLGTMDGANIEIFEAAGKENNIPFGMSAEEVVSYRENYNPEKFLEAQPEIKALFQDINGGLIGNPDEFKGLLDHLMWGDPYLVLPELKAHSEALDRSEELYNDSRGWSQKSLLNIASSGVFSSDRTIAEYASEIWKLSARKPD